MSVLLDHELSFEEFYRQQRDALVRALVFTVGDAELATDAVDEALARAFERWASVGHMQNPPGWVYRVALNHVRGRFRRRTLERRRSVAVERNAPDIDGWSDPAIAAALVRLRVEERAVVVLRFYLDWSVDDVAAALHVAPGTVKSRLHRSLTRLEQLLEDPR